LHRFTASDGGVIAYREGGDPSARPLVLLHGLMAHGGFFREQAALARHFRMICIDLRGHGESRSDATPPTVERAAADIAELAAALDLTDALGIGWSLGATLLWHVLAGPEGSRFAGAIVVDMTARVRNDHDWELGLSPEACEARSAAIRQDFPTFAAAAGQRIFAQPVAAAHQADAAWASAEFARNDPAAIAALWESLERQDVRSLLRRISHPTLIVHGGRSALYGDDTAEHLVSELPRARAVRFAQSGHSPHLEEPEQFNRTVTDFAAELPPVASARK
jgi:pimeloyl-ACP methyl ester carboxylesterase